MLEFKRTRQNEGGHVSEIKDEVKTILIDGCQTSAEAKRLEHCFVLIFFLHLVLRPAIRLFNEVLVHTAESRWPNKYKTERPNY